MCCYNHVDARARLLAPGFFLYTPQAWQTENPGSQVPDPIQGVSLDQLYKLGLAEVGGRGMACNQGFSDRRGEGGFARGISAWQPGRDG